MPEPMSQCLHQHADNHTTARHAVKLMVSQNEREHAELFKICRPCLGHGVSPLSGHLAQQKFKFRQDMIEVGGSHL